jgi:hypothetical protein
MCPKCNGPTIERPLFTSLYRHCERCDTPSNPCKAIGLDGAPFMPGDTVYVLRGPAMGKERIVRDIEKRRIRQPGHKEPMET